MKPRALILTFATAATTLFAQTPKFEAADVHPSPQAMNPYTVLSGGMLRGERYDLRKATMLDMIRIAFRVAPATVVGGPNWLEFDRFDIAAKAPARSSPETVSLMLQSLLADRFKLAIHKDTRPIPAFALEAGKGKPNLMESMGDGASECEYRQQPAGSTFAVYSCRNMTMRAFAEWLRSAAGDYLTDPVVDATGLDGPWDFDLKWNHRSQALPGGVDRVTIFDAVAKQLGLSLTPHQAPAPVLVVDSVNEKPTGNAPDVATKLPPREIEFEVADLKPSRPDERSGVIRMTPGGGFEARAVDLSTLIAWAWDISTPIHPERFSGLPNWTDRVRFDINAKASTGTNGPPLRGAGYISDEGRLMLRALLIDRFHIRFHYEDRLVTAYSLIAGKPKMKPGSPGVRASCKTAPTLPNDPRDANPILASLFQCRNVTMAQFASELQAFAPDNFAYPVEDATGLSGRWDFLLSFTPAGLLSQPLPLAATSDAARAFEPSGAVPLPEAIGKELGLKLETRKRMLPVVVIEHIDEKPVAN